MNDAAELKAALRALEIFSARHPRPSQVTQVQAAEMLGRTRRHVYNLIQAKKLRLNGDGLIPVEQIDALLASDHA